MLIATLNQFSEDLYWDTVRNQVDLKERRQALQGTLHHVWATERGRRGIIGASAAIAWRGEHDHTWECTAWRGHQGERNVPANCVVDMANKFPLTFMNRDPNRALIAPRTPCPVLYGIRGETRKSVLEAHAFLQCQDVEQSVAHRAWRTNQATGDHLSGVMTGTVQSAETIRGGHVCIQTENKLFAFEPSGPVNQMAQSFQQGDEIEWAGLRAPDGSFHLENIRLIQGVRNRARPMCECGHRFKSKGVGQSLKCPNCSQTHDDVWCSETIASDWTEPTDSNRRHLAKPLSRRGKSLDRGPE